MRSERGEIVALLQSDLYERVPDLDPECGMTWMSPLRWQVRITGTKMDPVLEVMSPDGLRYFGPERCSASRLDEVLP